jgi:hypothetical protein
MDLKSPGSLDPKLKEAYDRIMGSSNNTQNQTADVTPQPPMSEQFQPTQQTPIQNLPQQPTTTILNPQPPIQESPVLQPQQPPIMETQPIENLQPLSNNLSPMEQDITSSPLINGGTFFGPAAIPPQLQNVTDGDSPVKKQDKKHLFWESDLCCFSWFMR